MGIMHLIIMLLIVSASQRIESCHCAYVSVSAEDMQKEQKMENVVKLLGQRKWRYWCSVSFRNVS